MPYFAQNKGANDFVSGRHKRDICFHKSTHAKSIEMRRIGTKDLIVFVEKPKSFGK